MGKSTSADTIRKWTKAVYLDSSLGLTLVCKADVETEQKGKTDLQDFVAKSGHNLGNWVGSNPCAIQEKVIQY